MKGSALGGQWLLYLLVVLAAAVASSAESLGPPKMSRGTIDWRYPNEIVKPLPECPREGVYPHPRNCTWYYRCHDRLGLGFYYRTYYECEPGTVFSDELDQCVFPHLVPPPCGVYQGTIPTPGGRPPQGPNKIPDHIIFPGTSTGPVTIPGTSTGPVTIPGTSTGPVTIPGTNTGPVTIPGTSTGPVTVPGGSGGNGNLNYTLSLQCVVQYSTCWVINLCPVGSNRFSWQLCEASQVCYIGSQVILNRRICQAGSYFNPQHQQCYFLPQAHDICPVVGPGVTQVPPQPVVVTESPNKEIIPVTSGRPIITTTPTSVIVIDEQQAKCSDSNPRPADDWIKRKFCNSFALCDSDGRYMGAKRLCVKYYQCSRLGEDWQTNEMVCDTGMLFSFDDDKCVDKPSNKDLCGNFLRFSGVDGSPYPFIHQPDSSGINGSPLQSIDQPDSSVIDNNLFPSIDEPEF